MTMNLCGVLSCNNSWLHALCYEVVVINKDFILCSDSIMCDYFVNLCGNFVTWVEVRMDSWSRFLLFEVCVCVCVFLFVYTWLRRSEDLDCFFLFEEVKSTFLFCIWRKVVTLLVWFLELLDFHPGHTIYCGMIIILFLICKFGAAILSLVTHESNGSNDFICFKYVCFICVPSALCVLVLIIYI